jgi:hypothetical protein
MTHRPKWTIILPLLIPLIIWIGCEDNDTTTNGGSPVPVITDWQVPQKMAYNSPRTERIMVTVEDAQGPSNVPYVQAVISEMEYYDNSASIDTFLLYDDGSHYSVQAHPPWADSISGDLIPGDGIFSRRISGQFVTEPTEVSIRFDATDLDGNAAAPVYAPVFVTANLPPILEDPQLPAILESGFDSLITLSVRATEPDDLDSLVRVWLEVEESNKGEIDLKGPDADNRYSIDIDRSFAAGIDGDKLFLFYAQDTFLEIGGPIGQLITVENNPPTLSNLVMPDTMYLPTEPGDCDTADIFLDVDDDQTLIDIYFVYFTTVLNDTNPPSQPFAMVDDGTGADLTAGDGTYSQGIVLCSYNTPGKYTFTFIAEDLLEQESDPLEHDLWVISPATSLSRIRQPVYSKTASWRHGPLPNPFQTEGRDR